ncbi:MAG: hypothetical protein AB7D39_17345 [Pseudodesulfovibrio sp.]|uniref:hypothetical protein n=1 Tax=Pseudodesulfovibrio sp. TaxID=2035812 RepID=UPI003D0A630F
MRNQNEIINTLANAIVAAFAARANRVIVAETVATAVAEAVGANVDTVVDAAIEGIGSSVDYTTTFEPDGSDIEIVGSLFDALNNVESVVSDYNLHELRNDDDFEEVVGQFAGWLVSASSDIVVSREFAEDVFRSVTGLDIDNDDPEDIARLIARESDLIVGQYSGDGVAVQARPVAFGDGMYYVEVDVLYADEDGAHQDLRTFDLDLDVDLEELEELGFSDFVESVRGCAEYETNKANTTAEEVQMMLDQAIKDGTIELDHEDVGDPDIRDENNGLNLVGLVEIIMPERTHGHPVMVTYRFAVEEYKAVDGLDELDWDGSIHSVKVLED